mmetsp:Transcript_68438/g.189543  ORF Transcript_68438/g.189543 Transcript_68438/m.189543 type:complete len:200 (-) Transcript_68438:201-800(-)
MAESHRRTIPPKPAAVAAAAAVAARGRRRLSKIAARTTAWRKAGWSGVGWGAASRLLQLQLVLQLPQHVFVRVAHGTPSAAPHAAAARQRRLHRRPRGDVGPAAAEGGDSSGCGGAAVRAKARADGTVRRLVCSAAHAAVRAAAARPCRRALVRAGRRRGLWCRQRAAPRGLELAAVAGAARCIHAAVAVCVEAVDGCQ